MQINRTSDVAKKTNLSVKYQALCDETAMVGVVSLLGKKAIEKAIGIQKLQAHGGGAGAGSSG